MALAGFGAAAPTIDLRLGQRAQAPATIRVVATPGQIIAASWGGTAEQMAKLISLRYPNSNDTPIFAKHRPDIIIEIIGLITHPSVGYDVTLQFLNTVRSPEDILWKQPLLVKAYETIDRELTIAFAGSPGIKKLGKCRYCGSEEMVFSERQTRSADEGASIFGKCVLCGLVSRFS